MTKLFIAVPSNRGWSPYFGNSIVGLVKKLTTDGVEFYFDCLIGSSLLPRVRSEAIKMARKNECTHILFLDDDMAFPENIVDAFLAHDKPVIVANSSTKQAWNLKPTTIGLNGKHLYSKGKTGAERILASGLAVSLINLKAIQNINEPLFAVMHNGLDYIGEDFFFFNKLNEAGIDSWVDHDISNKIAHIGDYGYGVQ